ncbi:unnamed protein product [Paramecium sonneborni]|uniref:Uncharacterized protein n=1 Tax=Paramecium sonneborni TaxID=65129 RepID=A0A8S1QJ41_9CILI|nr:unnamed protein product [Paramecium sonneborni]
MPQIQNNLNQKNLIQLLNQLFIILIDIFDQKIYILDCNRIQFCQDIQFNYCKQYYHSQKRLGVEKAKESSIIIYILIEFGLIQNKTVNTQV